MQSSKSVATSVADSKDDEEPAESMESSSDALTNNVGPLAGSPAKAVLYLKSVPTDPKWQKIQELSEQPDSTNKTAEVAPSTKTASLVSQAGGKNQKAQIDIDSKDSVLKSENSINLKR